MTDAVETTPEHTSLLPPPTNPDFRWYVVHAYSGMEKAVERNITERINRAAMQDKFGRIMVPTEEVVEIKNGQKRTTERRFFPGYVLVEMIMDDESWHLQLDEADDFFRHDLLLAGDSAAAYAKAPRGLGLFDQGCARSRNTRNRK